MVDPGEAAGPARVAAVEATSEAALPPGTLLAGFDRDLVVDEFAGRSTETPGPDAITLADVLDAAEPVPLEAAARRALQGRITTLACRSGSTDRELIVRLGPAAGRPDRGVALWFDGSDLGRGVDRKRAEELELTAAAIRELARSTDADDVRTTICQAAHSVCSADAVMLFETDPDAGLMHATSVDADADAVALPLNETSGATMALRTNAPTFVADSDAEPPGAATQLRALGISSALWQPIARGRTVRAVLMTGWRWKLDSVNARSSRLLEAIAVEAAVAIDRGAAFARLVSMARSDPLTGLPNRRAWAETLDRELARAAREHAPLSVVMLDLDGFKAYNDSAGHPAGDLLLKEVADFWSSVIRTSDTLARYGGDEFAVLLPRCELDQAHAMVDRLAAPPGPGISFGAGAATWDGSEDAAALVERADRALYEDKSAPGTDS